MITIRVYDRDLNFVGLVPHATNRSIQDQLGKFGDGLGTFTISRYAPELLANSALIAYDNVVVMHDSRTNHYFPWIIEKKHRVGVSTAEGAGEIITVTGRGALAVLNHAVVLSEAWDIDTNPKTSSRVCSFASRESDWYNSSEWVVPDVVLWTAETSARRRNPRGWVDPNASWMWFSSASDPATPAGYCYFRTTLHLSGPSHVSMFVSADNAYDMWVDSEPVLSGSSWKRMERYDADLEAGDHIIAVRGYNLPATSGNPAGVLFSCWTSNSSSGKLDTMIRHSNADDWLCRDGTTSAPGWDPGDVLKTFTDEGKARGVNTAFARLHCDWTPNEDTDGQSWDDADRVRRTFALGTKVLTAARQLAESSCDVRMVWDQAGDADHRLNLQVFKHLGTDRTIGANNPSGQPIVFQKALNVLDTSYDGDNSGSSTALLIKTDLGWVEEVSATYGAVRKEDYVSLGASEDLDMAIALAAAAFEKVGPPAETIQTKALPVTNYVPFLDFFVGDDVLAPNADGVLAKTRVVAITLADDADGTTSYTPEFSTLPFNKVTRATQWLRSMADGALMGRIINATPAAVPATEAPTLANTIDVPFSFVGALAPATSARYVPRDDALLIELFATMDVAGTTDTVIDVLLNGTTIYTITIAGGTYGTSVDANQFFEGNVDALQMQLITPGTGASGLNVQARFN